MSREEKNNSSVGVDSKSFGNFLFDNFRTGLSDKDNRMNELQRSNEQLQNQLKSEEKNNFLLIREFDKLENRLGLMEKQLEHHKQQVDGKIKESQDRVYEKIEKRLEQVLTEFNGEVKNLLNKEEPSGLGDFFVKTGLNSVVASKPVSEAIAKAVLKFVSSEQEMEENVQNNRQRMSNFSPFPNYYQANTKNPQQNFSESIPESNPDDNNLNNFRE
ncbi:hypothetical protein D9V86_02020 [Bacteroidetes/Chlorobi group bacterium ChocPot_Mid]|nr:MAG: hypothetical protein D9V86_02020 [Bacteroidetes/Chlorobi group bacterium ChocPot_Mid]